MNTSYSILVLVLFQLSCKHKVNEIVESSTKPDTIKDCQIVSVIDTPLPIPYFTITTGFEFPCGTEVKSYNFRAKNPWKSLPFPIISESNRFLSLNDQTQFFRKGGTYDYYLNFTPYNEVANFLSLQEDKSLQAYYCLIGKAGTRSYNYSPFGAVVQHYFEILATTDTVKREDTKLVYVNTHLLVLNRFGETVYTNSGKHYISFYNVLDTLSKFLIFPTIKVKNSNLLSGLEIHDLKDSNLVFEMELEDSLFFREPKLNNRYVSFEVIQIPGSKLRRILIIDLDQRLIRQHQLLQAGKYDNIYIDDATLILRNEIGEDPPEDLDIPAPETLLIQNLPILQKF